ncbi:MAG: hypothetical protein HY785_02075 [Oscillatoriophycideae cyanobacterium NC_groundwater_1537_Pr4_S-0.65um_50_18]|nr:hypothetical protein [Oscillatoriophycideae cyanobacterium NC_groundwater_1537_Pr4_S-0.65um_50_18]
MSQCLCCSEPLLRHIRKGGIYGFCLYCRQEMPMAEGEPKFDRPSQI